jgi:hypothetical protein
MQYWFPAKRFGWGWGLPITWQGWAVLFVFVSLVAAGGFVIHPRQSPTKFVAYVIIKLYGGGSLRANDPAETAQLRLEGLIDDNGSTPIGIEFVKAAFM